MLGAFSALATTDEVDGAAQGFLAFTSKNTVGVDVALRLHAIMAQGVVDVVNLFAMTQVTSLDAHARTITANVAADAREGVACAQNGLTDVDFCVVPGEQTHVVKVDPAVVKRLGADDADGRVGIGERTNGCAHHAGAPVRGINVQDERDVRARAGHDIDRGEIRGPVDARDVKGSLNRLASRSGDDHRFVGVLAHEGVHLGADAGFERDSQAARLAHGIGRRLITGKRGATVQAVVIVFGLVDACGGQVRLGVGFLPCSLSRSDGGLERVGFAERAVGCRNGNSVCLVKTRGDLDGGAAGFHAMPRRSGHCVGFVENNCLH